VQQLAHADSQAAADANQIDDGHGVFATFNAAHVTPIHSGLVGQRLLRQPGLRSQATDGLPDYKTTELAFTNKRVIAKFGLISRKTIELNISKVESMQVNQGILGRIFNYGTLVISGVGNPQAPILGISDPMSFRRAFMESQDSAGEARA
jgi:hypothetical protein